MGDIDYFPTSRATMRYGASYRFIVNHPSWLTNLAMMGLCILIPIVGQMVLIGWLIEIFALRLGQPWSGWQGSGDYPPFSFDRFTQYIERGVWPTLVAMTTQLVVMVPLCAVLLVGVGHILALRVSPVEAVILGVLLALVCLSIALLASLIVVPIMIRAAMLRSFGEAFNYSWIANFVRLMWKELVLEFVFSILTAVPIVVAGYLLCCIGIYPAFALILASQWHLYFQSYRVYVSRGGTPLAATGFPPPLPTVS